MLRCAFQTSNNMVRAEIGRRPLINIIIQRHVSFIKSTQSRNSALCHDALIYETRNDLIPNLWKFTRNFNFDIVCLLLESKRKLKKMCIENYDRFWKMKISESTKAVFYNCFKTNIKLEPHLSVIQNIKQRIALSRFRTSNHSLMIEKGRHSKIDKCKRLCVFCPNDIEDEKHFLIICPLYSAQRKRVEIICNKSCNRYKDLNPDEKFVFLMSNETNEIVKALGIFVLESMITREKIMLYFFES